MKTQFLFLSLLLLVCLLNFNCSSIHYSTRLIFWNVPSPKDYKKFPKNQIKKSVTPYHFTEGTKEQERQIYAQLAKSFHEEKYFNKNEAYPAKKVDAYLKKMKTAAFLVITNDTLVFEKYYNKYHKESIQTSFSIAKSVVSLLVGKALSDNKIKSIEDPITNYLPELLKVDKKFSYISVRNLLLMQSNICHNLERDGLKVYYYPNLEDLVLTKLQVEDCKHKSSWYNNYHTVLLGLILERTTGVEVSKYFEEQIWSKIGTESNASWSTDKKGLPLMAAGINARAIDFAKIGKLVLDNGYREREAIIDSIWIATSVTPPKNRSYAYHWWKSNLSGDFYAQGIWGQILYISPSLNTIIIRHGKSKGKIKDEISGDNWGERIEKVAATLQKYAN